MKCKICGKKTESEFCESHEESHRNLLEKYTVWKRSMNVSWTEYLKEIQKNPNTGLWVKEVAEYLLTSHSP